MGKSDVHCKAWLDAFTSHIPRSLTAVALGFFIFWGYTSIQTGGVGDLAALILAGAFTLFAAYAWATSRMLRELHGRLVAEREKASRNDP